MSAGTLDPTVLIEWPDDATAARALAEFAVAVRRHYGDRLVGIYLFGSRARGDHRPDSDADVAVILTDGDWTEWKERWSLSRLAYEPGLDSGLFIQPWPFAESEWSERRPAAAKELMRSAKRDAVSLDGIL